MKKVWITALTREQEPVQKIMTLLKNYGLTVDGHFWEDDLGKMVWNAPLTEIAARETALWIIMGTPEAFNVPSVRLGLSLLAISVQAKKDYLFPVMIVPTAGVVDAALLPTALAGADIMPYSNASLGARVVAKANMPAKKINADYRLDTHALPGIGLWLEVGPAAESWEGVIFGVSGGGIDAHGTGKSGEVPQRAVLEYPVKGMKLALSGIEYTAWGVKNKLDFGQSYYVRVKGEPDCVLFGAFPEGAEADLYSLKLK
jgi:hypothetical protein